MATADGQDLPASNNSHNRLPDNLLIRHFTQNSLLSALNQSPSSHHETTNLVQVSVPSTRLTRPSIPPPPPPTTDKRACSSPLPAANHNDLQHSTNTSPCTRADTPPDVPVDRVLPKIIIQPQSESALPESESAVHCDQNQDQPDSICSVSLNSPSRATSPSSTHNLSPDPNLIPSSSSSDCSSSLYLSCNVSSAHSTHARNSYVTAARAASFSSNSYVSNQSVTSGSSNASDASKYPSASSSVTATGKPDTCTCHCHCKNRRSNASLKTTKLLSCLAKLTINSIRNGLEVRSPTKHSPSPSTISLASNNVSLSRSSSIQEHQYQPVSVNGNAIAIANVKTNASHSIYGSENEATLNRLPNRSPPPPPSAQPTFRTAAILPEPEYEDSFGLKRSVENMLRQRYGNLLQDADMIYEQLEPNDAKNEDQYYDSVKEEEVVDSDCDHKSDQDEDLYQDVLLFEEQTDQQAHSIGLKSNRTEDEERIYETLSIAQAHMYQKEMNQNIYGNRDTINQMDRKLLRQQKALDKKRQMQAYKLQKKFNLTGNEIPLNAGVVKADVRGNQFDLRLHKNEIVLILRIDGNPPGKWLAKNERGKIGYVDLDIIDVDIETIKSLMNVPNVFKESVY